MTTDMATIDVCVATYKRPELLRQLLNSLLLQETEGRFTYAIIVVDNDKGGSAKQIVKTMQGNGLTVIYDIEPVQNISLARNRAIGHATGQYIASIDDDEQADSQWLLNLFQTIRKYQAGAVIGQVCSKFSENIPDVIRKSRLFSLPSPPTGSITGFVLSTNNCIMKSELTAEDPAPFDAYFGLTGGGDSVFFEQLKGQNVKIVYCREAIVFETIPPNRTKASWQLKRFFRNGQITYFMAKKELIFMSFFSIKSRRNQYLKKLIWKFIKLIIIQFQHTFRTADNRIEIAETKQDIAFCVGFLLGSIGFRYQFYK